MKSILVTGGTGSFGRAFVSHVLKELPSVERVAILSRGEHAQADMAVALSDSFGNRTGGICHADRVRYFVGDIRDRDRLRRAFTACDTVIHAAALKRIEVGQYNPYEMVQTNIIGSQNVIEAALDAGVSKVVFLSSDKAFEPISPYGQSKALAESLFRNAYQGNTKFAVTRYGNVWQSQGSVVPKWQAIIAKQPKYPVVPITDPDATRFFMRMSEAIGLVIDTIMTMRGGELRIPDLPAFRMGDLAEAMGASYELKGLPSWEKKHESMNERQCSATARRMTVDELREVLREDSMCDPGTHGLKASTWKGSTPAQWADGNRGNHIPLPEDFGGCPSCLRDTGYGGKWPLTGDVLLGRG